MRLQCENRCENKYTSNTRKYDKTKYEKHMGGVFDVKTENGVQEKYETNTRTNTISTRTYTINIYETKYKRTTKQNNVQVSQNCWHCY